MSSLRGTDFRILAEKFFRPAVAVLLCLLAIRLIQCAWQESETIDEGAHLAAGYSYWKTGDFRLLPSHPPFAELLCAAPLLILNPEFAPPEDAWKAADEYAVGKYFLYHNRVSADTLLFAGRCMTILVTLILGWTIAWWSRRRFGAAAAIFSLILYSSSPIILSHGHYVTTDLIVSAFLLWSCLAWLSYLETGSRGRLIHTGLLAALAFASKFSGLILYPIFLLLELVHTWMSPASERPRQSATAVVMALFVLPALIICALFFFDTRSVLQDPLLGPKLRARAAVLPVYDRVPVPGYYYARGLHVLFRDLHAGHPEYFLGHTMGRGTWLYFPVAFLIKTPVAMLLLMLICAALAIRKLRRQGHISFVWLALSIPAIFYFAVSLSATMNIGIRHILPVYPFLFVLMGAVLFRDSVTRRTRRVEISALILGIVLVVESAWIHPHYLAFFNVLSGGPERGPQYLLDSNLDWGQDLKKLKRWTDSHGATPLCLSYFGQADPKYYGIVYKPLVSARNEAELANLDCVVAVSSHLLYGTEAARFRALHSLVPSKRVGYSIYVYDLRKRHNGSSA